MLRGYFAMISRAIGQLSMLVMLFASSESSAQPMACSTFIRAQIPFIKSEKCPAKCKGCGCQGGPGYRGPPGYRSARGECASFKDLIKVCGDAPHSKCIPECKLVVLGCNKPNVPDQDEAMRRFEELKQKKLDEKRQRRKKPRSEPQAPDQKPLHPANRATP